MDEITQQEIEQAKLDFEASYEHALKLRCHFIGLNYSKNKTLLAITTFLGLMLNCEETDEEELRSMFRMIHKIGRNFDS